MQNITHTQFENLLHEAVDAHESFDYNRLPATRNWYVWAQFMFNNEFYTIKFIDVDQSATAWVYNETTGRSIQFDDENDVGTLNAKNLVDYFARSKQ